MSQSPASVKVLGPSTVIGIDPSLNSTGIAARRLGLAFANCVGSQGYKGLKRIAYVRDAISKYLDVYRPSLVAFEGYALGFRGKSNTIFDLGELGGTLKLLILERGIDILLVPPTSLKLFATGKGNADKDQVSVAIGESLGVSYATSDQYDASGLLMMGEAYLDTRLLPRDRKHYKRRAIQSCTLLKSIEIGCK